MFSAMKIYEHPLREMGGLWIPDVESSRVDKVKRVWKGNRLRLGLGKRVFKSVWMR